jgi:UDP-glucose 4-epimerase
MSTTVLVTGANGFLASAVAEAAPDDWRMTAFVREGQAAAQPGHGRYDACFDSLDALTGNVASFDVVMHLAACIPVAGDDQPVSSLAFSNVALPARLLAAYPRARHVLASSVSVYGVPAALPLTADASTAPCSPYGWSKLAAEAVIRIAHCHAILRPSSIVGPGMRAKTFLPSAIASARQGFIKIYGDGSRTQDYLDVRDAAAMFVEAASMHENFVALAVSGRALSNLDVAREVACATGATIDFQGRDDSPSFAYSRIGSIPFGVVPRPFNETIAAMVAQ